MAVSPRGTATGGSGAAKVASISSSPAKKKRSIAQFKVCLPEQMPNDNEAREQICMIIALAIENSVSGTHVQPSIMIRDENGSVVQEVKRKSDGDILKEVRASFAPEVSVEPEVPAEGDAGVIDDFAVVRVGTGTSHTEPEEPVTGLRAENEIRKAYVRNHPERDEG